MNQNNPIGMIMNLAARCGKNPQAYAQSILQNNPDFAKAIQGQNPQQLAMQELQKRGIDVNQVLQFFRR